MDGRRRSQQDSPVPQIDLTDAEFATAAQACRALAYQ